MGDTSLDITAVPDIFAKPRTRARIRVWIDMEIDVDGALAQLA